MTNQPTILIIGNGQLGSALSELYGSQAQQVTRADIDFATASQQDYFRLLGRFQPNIVINTAAHTQVDKAEEEQGLATQINATAPGLLARACAEYNALLVHYSTDYGFNGQGDARWKESDTPAPINHYGATKLAGEQAIEASGAAHFIFRISWVYNAVHGNFVNTMLRLGAEREELAIIDDQIGAPCYAVDIAQATKQILDQVKNTLPEAPSGIYHMCHSGEVSWHGFAQFIFEQARAYGQTLAIQRIKPIPTSEYPTLATRPHNSRLDCSKLANTFGITLPSWQEGLQHCMARKYQPIAMASEGI